MWRLPGILILGLAVSCGSSGGVGEDGSLPPTAVSKEEQSVYVLLGKMVNPTYSRQEIVKKIEEAGGRVDEAVTVETDYVVAGKDAELLPEFDKALQLGIRVLREEELLQSLTP